jgi:uncharacterized protein (TIGR02996 family)
LLGLLLACKQQPEDTPRLLLADWLEENGDEADRHWAELIRLQLCPATPERPQQSQALCAAWGERWLGVLAESARKWHARRRPYGWSLLSSLLTLPDEGPRVAGWYAWRGLFTVSYGGTKGDAQALARVAGEESFARVAHLCLDQVSNSALTILARVTALGDLALLTAAPNEADDTTAEILASSPNFARLGALCLNSPKVTDRGLDALAGAAHLAALTSLSLIKVTVTDSGLRSLARAAFAPALRFLKLRSGQCDLGDYRQALAALGSLPRLEKLTLSVPSFDAAALAAAPGFAALREIDLNQNRLGDEGLRALVGAPCLPELRVLDISDNGLSDEGLRALADSDLFGRLTRLDLRTNPRITASGLSDFVSAPAAATLEDLDLSGNNLRDAGMAVLARSTIFRRLRSLRLHFNFITDEGVALLARASWLAGVQQLGLEVNEIGDDGVRALAECTALAGCRELILWGSRRRIGNAGAVALAASPHLRNLRQLDLHHNPIGDEGARALLASPHLAGLTSLVLATENLSPTVGAELKRRFGGE